MPKKIHDKLKKQCQKKGFGKERCDRYVYGTMARIKKAKKNDGSANAKK